MEVRADEAILHGQASPDLYHLDTFRDDVLEDVLEYAYGSDLITDCRLSSFSLTHLFGRLIQSTISATTEYGFTDCSHLTTLELPNPTPRSERPWTTDAALRLVCEAGRRLSDEEAKALLTQEVCTAGKVGIRNLKLELPVLGIDNDRDMRQFQKEFLARRDSHKRDHRIPFDPIDAAAGEGVELSRDALLQAETFLKSMESEKVGITRGSAEILVGVMRDHHTGEDRKHFILEEIRNINLERTTILEKLELPISPKLCQEEVYIHPSHACLVPIPSDPGSPSLSDDLKTAEACLLEDIDERDKHSSSILDQFLIDSSPSMDIEPARGLRSNHKVEMPLVPDLSPARRTLSGPADFSKFIVGEVDIDKELENCNFEDFSDAKMMDEFEAVAERTTRSIEQEQLQAADATARVPVPIMDFSIPEPEWTRLRNSALAIFKWIKGGHEDIYNLPRWPRDRLTESKLIWRPVGAGTDTVCVSEQIETSEDLIQSFIEDQDGKVPSSSDFVQRRDRLTCLDGDDEDDDIEPLLTKVTPRTNLLEIVGKRGLDNVDATSKRRRLSANKTPKHPAGGGHPTEMVRKKEDRNSVGRRRLLSGSTEPSARLLDRFTLGRTQKQFTVSKYFPSTEAEKDKVPALPSPPDSSQRNCDSDNSQRPIKPEVTAPSKSVFRAPCPSIVPSPTPLTVFISLSTPRYLFKALDRLVPNLTLIERDYQAHNTSVWSPGSVSRAEVVPPLAYDADITVSPTTGLLVTSMVHVSQKPRRGMSQSGLQERIDKVSSRYEHVIVLVGGEGGDDDTLGEISASDFAAFTELQGFACGLECKVVVHYIGGGDDTLSRWVASLVCRYAQTNHPQVQNGLLEAETLWELFLRRAGFNAYAAQAIAGQLKVPSSEEAGADSPRQGLAAFVTMTRAERRQRFGQLVGVRVLERVGRLVDEIWNKG